MKEATRDAGGNACSRSLVEKERTKIRERHRRSITTNIFHGLRKHGGYRLSPRADINEVLRHLAREAGWTVEPDGTTYRSSSASADGTSNACPLCGGGRKSTAPATPSGSYLPGGGECSTTASPCRESGVSNEHVSSESLLAIYMCSPVQQNAGGPYCKGQQLYLLQQNTASNHNTPAGSP